MRIQDLAKRYNEGEFGKKFLDSQFMISDRWISSTWIMGNNYKSLSNRGENDQPYYGSYPPGYLKRLWTMLDPDYVYRIIHLFSGSLTAENATPPFGAKVIRIDGRAELNPDILANAESFSSSVPYANDLVIADPPYSENDALRYGVCLCNKKKVLEECYNVLAPGGFLFWMDQSIPIFSKNYWNWVGVISIYRSTNHRIRGVMVFEKR